MNLVKADSDDVYFWMMGGFENLFLEIFRVVFVVALGIALLKTYIWYLNATRKKHTKKFSFGRWLNPKGKEWKKWMPYTAGLMALMAFPTQVGILWAGFWLVLIAVFVMFVVVYIGKKLFEGWSIKISDNDE